MEVLKDHLTYFISTRRVHKSNNRDIRQLVKLIRQPVEIISQLDDILTQPLVSKNLAEKKYKNVRKQCTTLKYEKCNRR